MPAVSPPRPPSLSQPPPPPPSEETRSETTQQVLLDDIIEERSIETSNTPSRVPPPPSRTESSEVTQQVSMADLYFAKLHAEQEEEYEEFAFTEHVIPQEVPASQAAKAFADPRHGGFLPEEPKESMASVDLLDSIFDEDEVHPYQFVEASFDAEVPAELHGMKPEVDSPSFSFDAPSLNPDQPSADTPFLPEPRQSREQSLPSTIPPPVGALYEPPSLPPTAARPANEGRGAMYMLGAAALIFLSVCTVVGYLVWSAKGNQAVASIAPHRPIAATPAENIHPAPNESPAAAHGISEAQRKKPLSTPASEPAPTAELDEVAAIEIDGAKEIGFDFSEEELSAEEENEVVNETVSNERSRARRRRSSRRASRGASSFDAVRTQAREHFSAHRYREAEQAYQRATALNSRHAGSWAGLGAARSQLRDYGGAAQAYQRAVQLNPHSSGFFTSLGHAYRLAGNVAAARQAYQRALALDPENGSAQRWIRVL